MVIENTQCIIEIEKIEKAKKKYVIEFNDKIYETDYEDSIIYIMNEDYININDTHIKMLKRIDFARELMLYSIMEEVNIEIWIGSERIKQSNSSDEEYVDGENVDVIIDIEDETSIFSAINTIGYAKIYTKNEKNEYILF